MNKENAKKKVQSVELPLLVCDGVAWRDEAVLPTRYFDKELMMSLGDIKEDDIVKVRVATGMRKKKGVVKVRRSALGRTARAKFLRPLRSSVYLYFIVEVVGKRDDWIVQIGDAVSSKKRGTKKETYVESLSKNDKEWMFDDGVMKARINFDSYEGKQIRAWLDKDMHCECFYGESIIRNMIIRHMTHIQLNRFLEKLASREADRGRDSVRTELFKLITPDGGWREVCPSRRIDVEYRRDPK
jgi:hypothetical protein